MKSNESHFYLRLMERFGISENCFDRLMLEDSILSYENYPLRVEYTGRSMHKVEINSATLIVIYDWERNYFVTALPSDYLIQDDDGRWIKNKRFKQKTIRGIDRRRTKRYKFDQALGKLH